MDLNDCQRKGFVKKTRTNPELARSLIEMSKIKEETVNSSKLNDNNISAYLPMAYDSLREILEAICVMNSYKVTSHVCIEKLLKSLYPNQSFKDFDRFRYIRNSINYYGKKVGLEEGKVIISKIFGLKNEFIKILVELLGNL